MEGKTVGEFIDEALKHEYDPAKAHQYYMRTRHLKGRHHGGKPDSGGDQKGHVIPFPAKKSQPQALPPQVEQRVNELKVRLATLHARLQDLLSKKRAEKHSKPEHKTAAEKTKEARASKKYRDAHKAEIAQKRKHDAAKNKSGGGTPISDMTEEEVRLAIARTHAQLQAAVASAREAVNRGTA